MLQHPSAFSRGIYPLASGGEMSGFQGDVPPSRQGINPQAESQSSLKAAISHSQTLACQGGRHIKG
ncbi:MAG: hypothetical protein B6245_03265 [Desulfobacteraceae bacterium 4572_88]|nr:MAG: hypothetical protein B6245_03265 [Desulfobacteraceae bacterium 4572_88]